VGQVLDGLLARDRESIGECMKIRLYPLAVARGKGSILVDVEGRELVDFTANWSVANTGYSHPRIVQAISRQAAENTFASYTSVVSEPTVALAERLIGKMPGDFHKKAWFGLSGSDANDCVAKLVPIAAKRSRIVSYFGAYHGQTGGSLSLSGHTAQARFMGSGAVVKIPYPYCYRCAFGCERGNCSLECLDFLEKHVFASVCPPDDTAAIIIEPVQCDGGDVVPPGDYMSGLERVCRERGIYLVLDEVKVGLGRTGRFFGFEHFGLEPDVVVVGKPLGSGLPISGVLARANILDAAPAGHLFTAGGCPMSAAAGLATLDVIEDEDLAGKAQRVGEYLKGRLVDMASDHPLIGDVRGLGMVLGVELVRNKATKEPASRETAKVCFRALEEGLVLFYVGVHSNVLEITPPLVMSEGEAERGLECLDRALADVEAGRVSDEEVAAWAGW